nr:ubiquitin-like-specific protease esd4 [Quercus suber]
MLMGSPYEDSMDIDGPSYHEDPATLNVSRGTKRPYQEDETAVPAYRLTAQQIDIFRNPPKQTFRRQPDVRTAIYRPRDLVRSQRLSAPATFAQKFAKSRAVQLCVPDVGQPQRFHLGSKAPRNMRQIVVDGSRDAIAARTAFFGRSPNSMLAAQAQTLAPAPTSPPVSSPQHLSSLKTEEVAREISSGWFVTTSCAILNLAFGLVTTFLAWFNHKRSRNITEEIVSVETAPRSNKRRAVGREVLSPPGRISGLRSAVFPPTPDASRPNTAKESGRCQISMVPPGSGQVDISVGDVGGPASSDRDRDGLSEELEIDPTGPARRLVVEPSLLVIGSTRGKDEATSRLFQKYGRPITPPEDQPAMQQKSTKEGRDSLRDSITAKNMEERRKLLLPSACRLSKAEHMDDCKPITSWLEPELKTRAIGGLSGSAKGVHKKQLVKNYKNQPPAMSERDREIESLVARATKLNIGSPLINSVRRNPRFARQLEAEVEIGEADLRAEKAKAAAKAAEDAARKLAEEKAEREEEAARQEALKKQCIVLPLSQDWSVKVDETMATTNPNKVLATAPSGADLRIKDFDCLLGLNGQGISENWLNDEVVNGFLDAAVARELEKTGHKKSEPAPVATYHSGWYNTVTTNPNKMKAISRWSRRKHIEGEKLLKTRKVLMPINTGAHWLIIIISPVDRTVEVLDSLHGMPAGYFRIAREWLAMELGEKYIAEEWIESTTRSSRQGNYNDCGAFTCFNALAAVKGIDYTTVKQADMQAGRRMIAAVLLNRGMTGDFDL